MCSLPRRTRFGLFIRTIGIVRAEAKLTLANLAHNFDRLVLAEKRTARTLLRPEHRQTPLLACRPRMRSAKSA